jgi:hypothetical protein
MKRKSWITVLVLVLSMALIFAGCGDDNNGDKNGGENGEDVLVKTGFIDLPNDFWSNDSAVTCSVTLSDYVIWNETQKRLELIKPPTAVDTGYRVRFEFSADIDTSAKDGVLFSGPVNGNWNFGYNDGDPFVGDHVQWGSSAGSWGLNGEIAAATTRLNQIELWSGNATGRVLITGFEFN